MSLRQSIHWKNLPLACKLSVPALVFGLSLVSVLVSVNAGLEEQHDATLVVNVAGRQRMLNQRLAKEVLERKTDPNVDLKSTIELLETSARALLEGGPVQLGEGQSGDLPAASSEHEGLLTEQVKLLHELEKAALALDQGSSVEAKALHELELCTRRFHTNANDLVIALQADAEASLSALVTRATVLAALAIILGIGITILVARQILASIRAVSDGIRRIAEGDLGFTMCEDRSDELGRMAQHMNAALDGIRASVGSDAVDWAEVARQKENQERLRSVITMVEHAPGGLLHTDAEGRLAYINPAAADLLRGAGVLPSSEDGLGVDLGTALRPLGCPKAGFQSPEKLPWSMLAEQAGHHLQLGAAAILDEDQNFIGTLLSIEEITERVRNEEAARNAADRERRQTEEIRAGVQKILGAVDAAANGDLRVRTGLAGEEPVERVGLALDRFLEVLQTNMLKIAGNIEQLSASADELSRNGAQLGEGADATAREANSAASSSEVAASNVSSMAAAIEEMTASMSEISRSAHSAAKVANRAVDAAEESNRLVSRLGDRSREIGDVIKVISAIADQTNLLALNATIEAARAGDAGKGFAVVAHEVKELASETARATEEISNRIDVIQHDIGLAVNTIQDIGEIINQINESQATIAAAVEEQSATTNEMGNNVHQTAASTDVIRSSITAVASQAELTAMGSKQTEDASRLVKSMAEELERLLSVYEVAAEVRPSRSPSLR